MLKIRLQRVGRIHEPCFRIVLTESKNGPKSGNFQEILGSYDARYKDKTVLQKDRIKHWLSKGVQVSDTLYNLFVSNGIIDGKKKNVLPRKSPIVKEVEAKDQDAQAPRPAENAPVKEAPVEAPKETPKEAPVEEKKEEKPVEAPKVEIPVEVSVEAPKPVENTPVESK